MLPFVVFVNLHGIKVPKLHNSKELTISLYEVVLAHASIGLLTTQQISTLTGFYKYI